MEAVQSLRVTSWKLAPALIAALLVLTVLTPRAAHADSSSLDTTCNGNGLRDDPLGQFDIANGVAQQADGKLLEAGESDGAGSKDFVVMRFNTNCTVDASFGTTDDISSQSLVRMDVSGKDLADSAKAILVQPDGKIVVAGTRDNGSDSDIAVVRLNSNGSPDDTFDGDGIATLNVGGNEVPAGVAIQSNGRIVVAGYTDEAGNHNSLLLRFNTNGSLDQSFNGVGWHEYDLSSAARGDEFTGVQIQSNGRIIASGWVNNGTDDDIVVARLTPGSALDLDTYHSPAGFYIKDLGLSNERATGVVLDDQGRAIYSAWSDKSASLDFYAERLTTVGQLDVAGPLIDFATGSADQANAIAIAPDHGIVLAGSSANTFALARLTAGLALDTTFNGTGLVTTAINGGDSAAGVLVQPDGRIVAAGITNASALTDFALARYQGNPAVSFSSTAYSVKENAGNAVITLRRTGATQDAITAHVTTSNGTAAAGSDYTAVNTDVGFAAGQATTTFNIPIVNDSTKEAAETINVVLTAAGGTGDAVVGSPSAAVLTINASDQQVDALVKYSSDPSYLGNNVYNLTGVSQTRTITTARGVTRTFYAQIQNDGNVTNSFKVKGGRPPSRFAVRYYVGSANVSTLMLAGQYSTGNLAPGAYRLIKIVITISSSAAHGSTASFPITCSWLGDVTRTDVAKAVVKVS